MTPVIALFPGAEPAPTPAPEPEQDLERLLLESLLRIYLRRASADALARLEQSLRPGAAG
jgi:hypothetical protein